MASLKPGHIKFEDAALGTGTVAYYAEDNENNKVHYSPKHDPSDFIKGISHHLKNQTILYLGNSQSHSINQLKDKDNTMSGYLFNDFIDSNITFLTASIPNANLQEHYLLYNYFLLKVPHLKLLIIPVFMDDLRESGIRDSYFKNIANEHFSISQNNELAQEINASLRSFQSKTEVKSATEDVETKSDENKDFNALRETTQDIVERSLNKTLKSNFSFWENRENIRGQYFLNLYKTRNTILGISSQSTRKMIGSRYNKNLNALKLMIKEAKQNGTQVMLIIPPIRQDIKYPYDINEYKKFKLEIEELANQHATSCVDIDNIIEGKYWGYSASTQLFKDKDYDFMHFQAEAHKIMADSIKPHLLKEL
jgi:hypothetical protein